MRKFSRILLSATLLLAAAAMCGCVSPQSPQKPAGCADRLKVGVYADDGPRGIGAVEWFRLVDESPEMELRLLDGKAVRDGGLKGLDLLVMPGGGSKDEFVSLGTNGVLRMKDFIRSGGGYIGTCAGACLLLDEDDRRARVMPWMRSGTEDVTFFPNINLNAKGAAVLGLKEGRHVMRFHGGPFMWPTTNAIAGAKFEVWGTMDAEASMKGPSDAKRRMYGSAAVIGGTYGKGRVFVTSAHPEYFDSTLYIVKAAFKYVTGRNVTFPARLHRPRSISVGFMAWNMSGGVATAETALALAREPDFNLVPIDADGIFQRRLDFIDVLVLTNRKTLKDTKAVAEFARRGGKIVFVGSPGPDGPALPGEWTVCGPREDAVRTIKNLFRRQ